MASDAVTINNLTRASHAQSIISRYRNRQRAEASAEGLWANRSQLFPSLLFGPEVEFHLSEHHALLRKIVRKLEALDRSAAEWQYGAAPRWRTKVTPESRSTMQSESLRDARLFQSGAGGAALFALHARVGSKYRIHLRIDEVARKVEIGYIGLHLPI